MHPSLRESAEHKTVCPVQDGTPLLGASVEDWWDAVVHILVLPGLSSSVLRNLYAEVTGVVLSSTVFGRTPNMAVVLAKKKGQLLPNHGQSKLNYYCRLELTDSDAATGSLSASARRDSDMPGPAPLPAAFPVLLAGPDAHVVT